MWKQKTLLGVKERRVDSARFIWKNDPEEHGGWMARSMDELMDQLEQALAEPGITRMQATRFLDRHMGGVDGKNGQRLREALEAWC